MSIHKVLKLSLNIRHHAKPEGLRLIGSKPLQPGSAPAIMVIQRSQGN